MSDVFKLQKTSADQVLQVAHEAESSIENGSVVARQVAANLDTQFKNIRADIISEYFSNAARADELFIASMDFDRMAFAEAGAINVPGSTKAVLGVLSDFVSVPRGPTFQKLKFSNGENSASIDASNQNRLL